jgi:hypothetical protein
LIVDLGAQAVAQTAACGDAALSQQEKNTRQVNRRAKLSLGITYHYVHKWRSYKTTPR